MSEARPTTRVNGLTLSDYSPRLDEFIRKAFPWLKDSTAVPLVAGCFAFLSSFFLMVVCTVAGWLKFAPYILIGWFVLLAFLYLLYVDPEEERPQEPEQKPKKVPKIPEHVGRVGILCTKQQWDTTWSPKQINGPCCVCLLDMEPDDMVRGLTECGHSFHKECVDFWLQGFKEDSLRCPLCRTPVEAGALIEV